MHVFLLSILMNNLDGSSFAYQFIVEPSIGAFRIYITFVCCYFGVLVLSYLVVADVDTFKANY